MRKTVNFNAGWQFVSGEDGNVTEVTLPHSYNGIDGQDGGNDYYRGECVYRKTFLKKELPISQEYFLEINGANSVARVFLNGTFLKEHQGGYSAFRVRLTEALKEENLLEVKVDNTIREDVYPQKADFTFYGGLYRNVNVIGTDRTHFELEEDGQRGLLLTVRMEGSDAHILPKIRCQNLLENDKVVLRILDAEGNEECTSLEEAEIVLPNAHLWDGTYDPYLYTCVADIVRNGTVVDEVRETFGCRSFFVDAERGFLLNGKEYPLHGVSRHQDFKDIGNALRKEHHEKDMELIREVGANTVRLAHYQQDAYFYDLCDKNGLIVWAEIPYISKHNTNANRNAEAQMRELILQNYNHPSICFWGISNEITMEKSVGEDVIEENRKLNELVHELDATRLSTMACFAPLNIRSKLVGITDLVGYNLYFGWYSGSMQDYGAWLDRFHDVHPNIPLALSEYGAEALNYHAEMPKRGDYTEEYQALYHEAVLSQIKSRKYLWATYVWNMFDFGADARNEGGENGQNHKGLVTIDRSYKKDAFYLYQANWSKEPFVHLCAKRYMDREAETTEVKIYSNLEEVELFVNGVSMGKQKSEDHIFRYRIKNEGKSELTVKAQGCEDRCVIRKGNRKRQEYILHDTGMVLNWNELTEKEGYFSLDDSLKDLMKHPSGVLWILKLISAMLKKKLTQKETAATNTGIVNFSWDMTLLNYLTLFQKLGIAVTKEDILKWNRKLNRIKK